jgi:hypothetical protein
VNEPLPIDYAHGVVGHGRRQLARALGVAGCVIGVVATALPLWPLWGFYKVPVGTSMRPMGLTFLLTIFAASGLLIALPLSVTCLAFGWRDRSARWIALLGILLSISAMCIGFGLFNWIVAARHFVLED